MEETITNLVEKELNCKVLDISVIGKGQVQLYTK